MGCCPNGEEAVVLTTIIQSVAQRGPDSWVFDARTECQAANEEPLRKQYEVKQQREPIPFFWIDVPRVVAIRNLAGLGLKVNPTPEEEELYRSQLLWIGTESCPDAIVVPPYGEAAYFRPNPDHPWHWQAAVGEIPVELFAIA